MEDRSPAPPQPRVACPDDERGRGLALVRGLTERWGTDFLPSGKQVWGLLTREVPEGSGNAARRS
ncbi:ATP-binding protein [Streptomyces sp. NBC_01190]|uniref:ATP-binding protein n=1 Tax=Streptomyces sp. NBC_01190 TaxID=2903767 RepID=UPI00386C0ACE|nr:ATP-binding protein [Streptomyces sp. NBC_01190]